jgi:hypothetical protein
MSDDTHLDHRIERDTVRENLKRAVWGYATIELLLKQALDALDRKDARIAVLEVANASLKEAESAEDYALGVELRFVEKIVALEAQLARARKFLADYADSERNYQSGSPPSLAEVEAFLREVKP